MSFKTDIAGDFAAVVDGLEEVTLAPPDGLLGVQSVEVESALRRAVSKREAAASQGKYTTSDTAWHFPLSAGTPYLGGTITDGDGGEWRILEAHKETLSARWRCICRELAIIGGLDTYITIQKRTASKASDGSAVYTWAVYKVNMRARIQQEAAQREKEREQRTSRITGTVFFAEQVLLGEQYRIVAQDGTVWEIAGDSQRDSITGLYTVSVERNT